MAFTSGVLVAASGVVLLAPVAEALPLVVRRLFGHENLREVFPLQLSPVLALLLWGIEMAGQVGGRWPLMWFDVARLALFTLTAVVVLACQWRGRVGLIESIAALSVAFTLLVITILWPWHLEVPVAVALIAAAPAWRAIGVLLTLLGLLSYFFTFAWAAVLLVVLAGALWIVRRSTASCPPTATA